ncbi:hypothetical protein KRR38_22235 [Novosphingobium sp. G106]|uniref:hypothetical protein n=1 Tax=Novosphingobium sp. G106 TaxID=2849500 RepID=UPI001C2DCA52|nr:hypothetical protein [Novosphingobium sp. G106]MBV1690327.1 hypothetical protein [Novosphingobium sp. G106]
MTKTIHSISVPWRDLRDARDLLSRSADAAFEARPVGNRVVIDCERDADAQRILEAFTHARRFKAG